MRRLIPWALVLLVGLGAAVGAALGTSPSSTSAPAVLEGSAAQQWLRTVLSTTKAAASAHVHGIIITTSSNPNLRASGSETGVVNFTTGDLQTTDVDHSFQWSSDNGGPMQRSSVTNRDTQIVIGRTAYDNSGDGLGWQRSTSSRRGVSYSLLFGGLGFGDGADLVPGSAAAHSVRRVGTATVQGVTTTRYLVHFAVPTGCPRTRPARVTTSVWVDAQGRLVQSRYSLSFDFSALAEKLPGAAFPRSMQGRSTYVLVLRLSEFGTPVRVKAPAIRTGPGTSQAFTMTQLHGSSSSTTTACSGESAGAVRGGSS